MFDMLKEWGKFFGPRLTGAKPMPKIRRTLLWLEALERRDCPTGPDIITIPNGAIWNPQPGSNDGTIAANYVNGILPDQDHPLVLDGSTPAHNQPITFSANLQTDIASIQVVNGYQKTLTFSGGTLKTLDENDIYSNCTLTIASQTNDGGVILKGNNDFVVQFGATLKLTDNAAAKGGTFIDAMVGPNGTGSGEYLSNAGKVIWTGTAVAAGGKSIADSLEAPVTNTGEFDGDGGTAGNTNKVGGTLLVFGQDGANTHNVGFYNNKGTVKFANAATLAADQGFYQSNGSISSDSTGGGMTDGQECVLQGGIQAGAGSGDINIAGGSVTVDSDASSLGTLKFYAKTVEFNGQLNVSGLTQDGGFSTKADLLDCTGATVQLQANSSLNVGTKGTAPLGTGNRWTVMKYAGLDPVFNKWGKVTVPPTMQTSTGANDVLVSN